MESNVEIWYGLHLKEEERKQLIGNLSGTYVGTLMKPYRQLPEAAQQRLKQEYESRFLVEPPVAKKTVQSSLF